MLEDIKKGLNKSINRAGIVRQVSAARTCEAWREAITVIFAPDVANKTQALKCKNGVMTVAVLNSVFAQEFRFKEDDIKQEINRIMGYEAVKIIRYEI